MADVAKHFRWGASVLAILHHFSTPEVRALFRYCRKLIKDFCNPAYEGEGYRASVIPFEMYEYGFVLAYDYDLEEWVLDVVAFPHWGSPHCRRRPPSEGASQRVIAVLDAARRPTLAQLADDLTLMVNALHALVPILRSLVSAAPSLRGVAEMLHKTPRSQSAPPRTSPIIEMFTQLAEQPSHHCVEVVQLVRARLSSAVSFLDPLWTLPPPSRARFERWDASWFGALPEQASG